VLSPRIMSRSAQPSVRAHRLVVFSLWLAGCGESLNAPIVTELDAASPDASLPVGVKSPGADAAVEAGPKTSSRINWSYSLPEPDRVLAIVPHPTSPTGFGVLVQDPDDVVKFKITTDLGRTFSRPRFIGVLPNVQVVGTSWSQTDPSLIALLLGEGVLQPLEVLVSFDAGRYFSAQRQQGPTQRIGHLSTEGGVLRVRVGNTQTSSTLYTFGNLASPTPTWVALLGAPGGEPFAVRPSVHDEVLAASTVLMRCVSGVCAPSNLPAALGDVRFSELEFNPNDNTQVIAKAEQVGATGTEAGYVLFSRNAGASFAVVRRSLGSRFERAFFERRLGSATLFALADKTVLRSPDSGLTWEDVTPKDGLIPDGRTAVYVYDIAARAGGGLLAKGTFNYYFLAPQP
jgi:hypothetical protein